MGFLPAASLGKVEDGMDLDSNDDGRAVKNCLAGVWEHLPKGGWCYEPHFSFLLLYISDSFPISRYPDLDRTASTPDSTLES